MTNPIARYCAVCAHPERAEILEACERGESLEEIESRFGVSAVDVIRHRRAHVRAAVGTRNRDEEDILNALRQLSRERSESANCLYPAMAQDAIKLGHQQVDRQVRTLALSRSVASRESGEITREEWDLIRTAVFDALEPHQDASAALAELLAKLES